ncbi:hypothetical protein IWQ57_001613, partial [Coemansia nantahalensis]
MGTGPSTPDADIETQGVVPRGIDEIWRHLEDRSRAQPGFAYSVDASFLELYNEDLIDLLNPRAASGSGGTRGPTIREDSHGNMVLVGVERKPVRNSNDILALLHQGALSRTTASTDMNRTSSRSHAIFTIHLQQQDRRSLAAQASGGGVAMTSKMHFVDLAGSERIKRTGAAGDRAREGISINAGLLALGNVISALGNAGAGGAQQPRRAAHVPYRDSKLTRLLQDSLGGNSQTLMLACISPSDDNGQESLNTIRYANRARNIRNKVAVNFDKNSSVELSMLKTEVARLRGELSKVKLQRRQLAGDAELDQRLAEAARLQSENSALSQNLHEARRRATILEHERDTLRVRVAALGGSVHSTPALATGVLGGSAHSTPTLPPGIPAGHDTPDGGSLTRPNSLFAKGDVLSEANVLETIDQELSEQAERHEHQIASVRRHYEAKLELARESLAIVQRERDVALQRLANSARPRSPAAAGGGRLGVRSGGAQSRLRLPSRASATPPSRKASATDLGSSSRPQTASAEDAARIQRLQNEVARLRSENKALGEDARSEAEQLAVQVQQQAEEIARLRRRQQPAGRRESQRCSLLGFKENSWSVAKQTDGPGTDGPQLLRAAFIKAVLEGELQRCVRARQLLRERDAFLNRQDRLMNKQNDHLLSMQALDLECDDEYAASEMAKANERIEIIDAELKFLDFKVRDAEAEIAQLVEAAAHSGGGGGSSTGAGLTMAPAITNLSGLAMRMVEDVVRIDYRAFVDFFEGLSQGDSTGMAYLFMQDIIEHRLVAIRDEQERTRLGEELLESRRTLLAMQKTAISAALSYERELGDAERKLSAFRPPLSPLGDPAPEAHAVPRSRTASNELTLSDAAHDAPTSRGSGRASPRAEPLSAPTLSLDRSVYRSVRERGILLRSALLCAHDPSPGQDPRADQVSDRDSDQFSYSDGELPQAHESNDSIYAMLDPRTPALDDGEQFAGSLYGKRAAPEFDDLSLYAGSLGVSGLQLPESDTVVAPATTADVGELHLPNGAGEPYDYLSESEGYAEHLLEDAMDQERLYTPTEASDSGAPIEPALQSDGRGYASDSAEAAVPPASDAAKDAGPAVHWAPAPRSDTEGHLSEGDASDGEIPELYRSGSGEFFRLPNLARKRSARSRQRRLMRRLPLRRKEPKSPEHSAEIAWAGGGRCISAQRKHISRPIVPPEMVDYVDRCNPGAFPVGDTQPILASPELFRKMRIPITDEYRTNIAAMAQYTPMSMPGHAPLLVPQPAESAALAVSTAREPGSRQTRSSSDTYSASSPPFTPRSAGRVALGFGPTHAAGAPRASQDALDPAPAERTSSPPQPAPPRRPYTLVLPHHPRMSLLFGAGETWTDEPFRPPQEMPA